jgi:hypothetical protein
MIGIDSDRGGGRITGHEASDELGLLAAVLRFATLDDEVTAGAPRGLQRADQEHAEIGRGRIGVQQTDMGRFAGSEISRRAVRRVIELLHGIEDGHARALADILAAVDHAGDGHCRHARGASDVLDRHGPPASSAWPVHLFPFSAEPMAAAEPLQTGSDTTALTVGRARGTSMVALP